MNFSIRHVLWLSSIAAIALQVGVTGRAIHTSAIESDIARGDSSKHGCPGPDAFKLEQTLPGIPFQVPQSYGGYLSVNKDDAHDDRKLYFFYTPTDNEKGQEDIIVWFNGGPGCSSMEGLFQETGPVLLPYYPPSEKFQPTLNAYSTHKVAHAIWIDSPGNTGFSQAGEHIKGLTAVAADVAGFLVNFFRSFPELRGKRLWLQGESYAGAMIPYMADHIYSHPELGLNLQGFHINDPSFANNNYLQQLPIYEYATLNKDTLTLSDDFLQEVKAKAEPYTGLTTYAQDNLVYPPKGPLSLPADWSADKFDIYGELLSHWNGAHCSSVYDISTQCPAPLDPLGYPQAASTPSADNFLNDTPGFKKAIHANESIEWVGCTSNVFDYTGDAPPQERILAGVIDRSTRSIIGNGDRDVLLLGLGAQLAIQNTTWGGQLGFQRKPDQPLNTAEGGQRGVWHTERKLTWIQYFYAGHMVPQDDRPAGFKTSQYLVGQIDSLS